MQKEYDVIILGGGLAGLTLSMQLKRSNPEISILVLEKRSSTADEATHKVGESTVELGTHYIREVLDLKNYLDAEQLPKHGLRFFFTPEHKDDIARRVELGPRKLLPIPSHQLDRGTFENELISRTKKLGTEVLLGAKVTNVVIDENAKHTVDFEHNKQTIQTESRWVVDATGRSSFLKRKFNLAKTVDHPANAAWFRVKGEIDIDNWSENKEWSTYVEPGLRRLSTIHLMDKGYWVWFIPLSSGNTSVGIVADPKHHAFETFNKFDRAMDWLKANEPNAFACLDKKREDVLDFKIMKHYSHSSEKLYSTERWAITGESGVFLDPFYSPGTDFIALNNTFISDLILRDKLGEDINLRTNVFERTHFALFNNWVPIYKDMYGLWGKTQSMVVKIFWDWATYWGVPTLLFTNEGYTNIGVLRSLFSKEGSTGQKFGLLNTQMQKVLLEWDEHDDATFTDQYIDPFDIQYLKDFHKGIDDKFSARELVKKVEDNVGLLEEIASELFRLMSHKIYGTSMNIKVDPYTMSLKNKPKEVENGVLASDSIKSDVNTMWYY